MNGWKVYGVVATLVALALCGLVFLGSGAAYRIGQTGAPIPTPERIVETVKVPVEVTKKVPVEITKIVEVVVTATPTAVPQPTATEAPAPKAIVEVAPIAEADVNHPYMVAYQNSLEYTVSSGLRVPDNLLDGFTPVPSLVFNPDELAFPNIPRDLSPYQGFVDVPGEWGSPIAGYNDGFNDYCDSTDGWCADDIQAFNWRVYTAYELCHPAVGCLKDVDGGAVMLLMINWHDSDEVWATRNDSAIYVDAGFVGYGPMWDLSGETYDVEKGVAAIRNHYLFQLGLPHDDNRLMGQCGSSHLCETVTYIVVYRMWDRPDLEIDFSHFQLVDYGQWVRN